MRSRGGAIACAEPGRTAVSGSFWEKGHHRAYFEAHLVPGQTERFEIPGNRSIEIGMMKSGKSTVKLVDKQGHALHFAALSSNTQPFRLAVCGTHIELASPADKGDVICAAQS